MSKGRFLSAVVLLSMAAIGHSQLDFTHDGSDGDFNPTHDVTIDLGMAPTKVWDQPSTVSGEFGGAGVYDKAKWAVVFKYTNVNIPQGVTVKFKNHPKNPPVMWLVTGNVTIAGRVILEGVSVTDPSARSFLAPGPGGFRSGRGGDGPTVRSAGFGAGGGRFNEAGNGTDPSAGFGSLGKLGTGGIYGSARLVPLIGGSGGGGGVRDSQPNGAAGGGAIFVLCRNRIIVTGAVSADGGATYGNYYGGAGSGGGIRLVADSVEIGSSAYLTARGGGTNNGGGVRSGGDGRISVEYLNTYSFSGTIDPLPLVDKSPVKPVIYPSASSAYLRVVSVGGVAAPGDPTGDIVSPVDLSVPAAATSPVLIEGTNLPAGWTVKVRIIPASGPDKVYGATLVGTTGNKTSWRVDIELPSGTYQIIARATQYS